MAAADQRRQCVARDAQQNQQNAVENMLLVDCALHPAQQVKHLCVMRQLHFFLLRRILAVEQFRQGDTQRRAERFHRISIGQTFARFPAHQGFLRYANFLRQLLLRHALRSALACDILTNCRLIHKHTSFDSRTPLGVLSVS